jgi:hypothetical protein
MPPSMKNAQPATRSADGVEEKVAQIAVMTITELRLLWRQTFASEPPSAFSNDLLARAIAYRVQEEAYGGLKPQTTRLLRVMASPGAEPPRQVKVGSVIVREHKGVLHEVMVVPGGFCWQGQIYDSLSTIAKKITGVSWNGPRFFGLRTKPGGTGDAGPMATDPGGVANTSQLDKGRASAGEKKSTHSGRRPSIRMGAAV